MSTLFTLVGKQPAAVAVTVKTLLQQQPDQPLRRVVLLATPQTQQEATRLQDYCTTLNPDLKIDQHIIALDPHRDPAPYRFAWEVIRDELATGELSTPVYYDTTPGLNYQVALISYHLRQEERLVPLYADYNHLYNLTTGQCWELADLGLKTLLKLYNLRTRPEVTDAPGMVADLELDLSPRPSLQLLRARERKGRLHGLVQVWRQEITADEKAVKRENHRLKMLCRRLAQLMETPSLLSFLRPIFTVWTNDHVSSNRCRAYGLTYIKGNQGPDCPPEVIQTWLAAQQEPPGSRKPGPAEQKVDFSYGPLKVTGAGTWTGPNLIVALGDDPSATLAAIFTHRPRKLVILVDGQTDWVLAMAGRLQEQAAACGAAEIIFWPTTLRGQIPELQAFLDQLADGPCQANISPGSKSQAWNMARLPLPALELWSLRNTAKVAACLTQEKAPLRLDLPPVLFQASCVGGKLASEGIPLERIRAQKEFYAACADVLASANPYKLLIKWQPGAEIEDFQKKKSIVCTAIFPPVGKMELKVKDGQQEYVGNVLYNPDGPRDGRWFEEVAAGALLCQFPEKIKDMQVGVRWAWLERGDAGPHFRTDLDILLRWDHAYVGIECKLAVPNDPDRLEDICNGVMAETRAGLGRFALPVLLRGSFPRDLQRAAHITEASIEMEPLEISLAFLAKKRIARIGEWLDRALNKRQVTKN